ncbi:hypothetical protein PLICRDRAFT_163538 [Plicaturopsis crispa FD-325 SS-3]|nr:hypothetical protein PLICRDRAFT_163538 [Plicaturopsis crispa FD-325 SS-3]
MDTSSVLSDDDYDVISNPGHSESSIADLAYSGSTGEPAPTQTARETFYTVGLSTEDVQTYVRKALEASVSQTNGRHLSEHRTVRVYVDGAFDSFHAGHALQLRQAKLSFPFVHLVVGVFPDDLIGQNGPATSLPLVERCEVVRHCRWVDEVIQDAPWTLDEQFIQRRRIDYVAVDEGASVDPSCGKCRVQGYDAIKRLGKVIPTRRTLGLSHLCPLPSTAPTPTISNTDTPFLYTPAVQEHMDVYGIGL